MRRALEADGYTDAAPMTFDLSESVVHLEHGDVTPESMRAGARDLVEAERLAAHYEALRDPPARVLFTPCGACAGPYLRMRLGRAADPIAGVLGIVFWALVASAVNRPLE